MSKVIILDSGKRWWAERILAAVFYACAIYFLYLFIINVEAEFSETYYIYVTKVISSLLFMLTLAIYYSYSVSHHFNLTTNRYRAYYYVGPIGFGKWMKTEKLKYVSVFLNSKDLYEVVVWDAKNNRYKVFFMNEEKEAAKAAKIIAEDLSIYFYEKK